MCTFTKQRTETDKAQTAARTGAAAKGKKKGEDSQKNEDRWHNNKEACMQNNIK